MLDRIFPAVDLLKRFPEAGRRGRIEGTRELFILPTPFVMAYRIGTRKLDVIALLHGSRKWPGKF
jgi:plasmid stabilization system protein ParE